jgi:hypothetical protein
MGLVCRIKIKCDGCKKDILRSRVIPMHKDIEKKQVQFPIAFEIPEGWGTDIKGGMLLCPDCLEFHNNIKI